MRASEFYEQIKIFARDNEGVDVSELNDIMNANFAEILALVNELSAGGVPVQEIIGSIYDNGGDIGRIRADFAGGPQETAEVIPDEAQDAEVPGPVPAPEDDVAPAPINPDPENEAVPEREAAVAQEPEAPDNAPGGGNRGRFQIGRPRLNMQGIGRRETMIGVIALVVILVAGVFLTGIVPGVGPKSMGTPDVGQIQPPNLTLPGAPPPERKPTAPLVTPLDVQNAPFLSSTQQFFIFAALLAMLWGLLDSSERRQMYDWVVALIAIAIVLFTSRAGILQAIFASIGLSNSKALIAMSLMAVIIVSLTAGRDMTPTGLFIKLIASGGLILTNMGELQNALNLTANPVLPVGQLLTLIQLHQMDKVWFSIWVYGLDGIAAAIFLYEIFAPHSGSSEWGSLLSAIVIIPTYFASRDLMGWAMLPSLLIANALAVVTASFSRNWGLSTGVIQNRPYGEVQIVGRFQVRTPWDGLLTGLVLLEILIMAIGMA